jgi:hypothetical protein
MIGDINVAIQTLLTPEITEVKLFCKRHTKDLVLYRLKRY